MLRYLFILTYLIISFIFSANGNRDNYFYGCWEVDIEKSLAANLTSKSLKKCTGWVGPLRNAPSENAFSARGVGGPPRAR
mgnify:CR=1 FL=1